MKLYPRCQGRSTSADCKQMCSHEWQYLRHVNISRFDIMHYICLPRDNVY